MEPEQIALVQHTWKQVLPIKEQAAALFYNRLFSVDPALRALFTGDMTTQGNKLMAMISVAVSGLTRLESILPAVQELGRRHTGYGVKAADYETVGGALLWTLQQGLGEGFTPEVKDAWTDVYRLLAQEMTSACEVPASA